jgi:hypothetical protein
MCLVFRELQITNQMLSSQQRAVHTAVDARHLRGAAREWSSLVKPRGYRDQR